MKIFKKKIYDFVRNSLANIRNRILSACFVYQSGFVVYFYKQSHCLCVIVDITYLTIQRYV